jgi:hypothetical protein
MTTAYPAIQTAAAGLSKMDVQDVITKAGQERG